MTAVLRVQVGPASAGPTQWDPQRRQNIRTRGVHPSNPEGCYVLARWAERSGPGVTNRQVDVNMDEVPLLIADLAAAYAAYSANLTKEGVAARIEEARRQGFSTGYDSRDEEVEESWQQGWQAHRDSEAQAAEHQAEDTEEESVS